MANTVKLKRGSGSDPSASDMVVGEPVIRTDTAELFFKKDDGSVAKVSGGGGGPDFKYLALRNAANNGSASYPGNDFTLVTSGTTNAITPAAANTLLVSYGGVIQKPNSGTSTSGITGFIVDGSRIKTATNFAAAPDFILYQESGGIGEPSDGTVTEAKLSVSNNPTNGYFLSAQSGNTGGLTWAAVDLSAYLPLAGGTLTGNLTISNTEPRIYLTDTDNNSDFEIRNVNGTFRIFDSTNTRNCLGIDSAGVVELRHENSVRLQTTSTGAKVSGSKLEVINTASAGDSQLYLEAGEGGTAFIQFIADNGDDNTDKSRILQADGANLKIQNYDSGSWATKLETTSDGVTVTGTGYVSGGWRPLTDNAVSLGSSSYRWYDLNISNDINISDNGKVILGDGADLNIWHQTGNSYITSTGANLTLRAAGHLYIQDIDGNNMADFTDGGAVELYWGGTGAGKKLETTSGGVDITGTMMADGIQIQDSHVINCGNSQDLQIYHSGSHSYIKDTGTGELIIQGSGVNIYDGNNKSLFYGVTDGQASLYHNNVEKIRTTGAGCSVFGDNSNYDTIKLEAQAAGGDPSISFGRYGFSTTSRGAAIKYEYVTANTQEQGHLAFYTNPSFNGTGSLNRRFQISDNGDLLADDTTIGSLSDSRLKKNIADYTYDLAKFKQLKPKTFDWINPEEHIRDTAVRGFVAQEVKTVDDYYIKESTFGNKKDKELITDGKGLTSRLGANDAMYVSVINQLITKIETLETKVAALEGA